MSTSRGLSGSSWILKLRISKKGNELRNAPIYSRDVYMTRRPLTADGRRHELTAVTGTIEGRIG